jgi:hypothetical protein
MTLFGERSVGSNEDDSHRRPPSMIYPSSYSPAHLAPVNLADYQSRLPEPLPDPEPEPEQSISLQTNRDVSIDVV